MITSPLAELAPRTRLVWTTENNVLLERMLWVEVLKAQAGCGVAGIAYDDIAAYQACTTHVDLASIERRERITRHDVKARIEEFNALAGGRELIHRGMTSADVVDNVTQWRMMASVKYLDDFYPDVFGGLRKQLAEWPLRGIQGAIGTQQDMLDVFDGDHDKMAILNQRVLKLMRFDVMCVNVGQVYPRSLDLMLLSQVAARVMSSVTPLKALMQGYLSMVAGYAGETWNEGDVTTSVTRRVCIPNLLFCAEAIARKIMGLPPGLAPDLLDT